MLTFQNNKITQAIAKESRAKHQLLIEVAKAQQLNRPQAARLMLALHRVLDHAPALMSVLDSWPGDLAHDAVIFRLNAGLHDLVRSGRAQKISSLYGYSQCDLELSDASLERALANVIAQHEDELLGWLMHPTQTNEVARLAGLAAVLMELNAKECMPVELLELGSSAGLNLLFQEYSYSIGEATRMFSASSVHIAPEWRGNSVSDQAVAIERAAGVDLNPLDIHNPEHCRKLQAYVWPGDTDRADRLSAALQIARKKPPNIVRRSASEWLKASLAKPQSAGQRRVVFHSMVEQYCSLEERAAISAALDNAGKQSDASHPLCRVAIEWNANRSAVEISVTQWLGHNHDGCRMIVGRCHPYGDWFEWHGFGD